MRAPQRHHLVELRIGRGLEGSLEPGRILHAEREARARTRLEQPAARRDCHLVTQMEVGPAGGTVPQTGRGGSGLLGLGSALMTTSIVSIAIASIAIVIQP